MSNEDKNTHKKSWFKTKILGLTLTLFSGSAAHAAAQENSASSSDGIKTEIQVKNTPSQEQIENELAATTYTKYKGLSINLDSIQPQDIAHVFESSCNPCITDGNRSIKKAAYLGLCQMAIETTLPNFIEQRCKDSKHFGSLYTFKKNHTIRSDGFMNEWKRLSHGAHAAEFERAQFEFMFKEAYKPVFNKLAKTGYFPEITLDNYNTPENFVYSAAVMSCVNQSPKRTDEIFLWSLNNICIQALKENKIKCATSFNPRVKDYKTRMKALVADLNTNLASVKANKLNIDDSYTNIAFETYPTKEIAFSKMKSRYVQEKKLLKEKYDRLEKQAVLANADGRNIKVPLSVSSEEEMMKPSINVKANVNPPNTLQTDLSVAKRTQELKKDMLVQISKKEKKVKKAKKDQTDHNLVSGNVPKKNNTETPLKETSVLVNNDSSTQRRLFTKTQGRS